MGAYRTPWEEMGEAVGRLPGDNTSTVRLGEPGELVGQVGGAGK